MTEPITDLARLRVADLDAGDVFSGQASGRLIKGFQSSCHHTPAIDPTYLFHDAMRELVVWFMMPPEPLYVFGPTGSGKSSLVRQVAAKLNFPSSMSPPTADWSFRILPGISASRTAPCASSMVRWPWR